MKPDGNLRPYVISCDWLQLSCRLTAFFRVTLPAVTEPRIEGGLRIVVPAVEESDIYNIPNEFGYVRRKVPHGSKTWQVLEEVWFEGEQVAEIGYKPHSPVIAKDAAVLKICNSVLYEEGAMQRVMRIVLGLGLEYRGITRLDLCMDFNEFYGGLLPQNLIDRYRNGEYWKVGPNEAMLWLNGRYHVCERKDGQVAALDGVPALKGRAREAWKKYVAERTEDLRGTRIAPPTFQRGKRIFQLMPPEVGSITWGKRSSGVQVQLYNKTKELREVKMKHYIYNTWVANGLDVDRDVWRLEIRIQSAGKELVNLSTGEAFRLQIQDCLFQEQLEMLFCSYAAKYFKFYKFTFHAKLQNNQLLRVLSCSNKPVMRPKRFQSKKDYSRGVVIARNRMAELLASEEEKGRMGKTLRANDTELIDTLKRAVGYLNDVSYGLNVFHQEVAKAEREDGRFTCNEVVTPEEYFKHRLWRSWSEEENKDFALRFAEGFERNRQLLCDSLPVWQNVTPPADGSANIAADMPDYWPALEISLRSLVQLTIPFSPHEPSIPFGLPGA